jgi:hypothetical protein
MTIIRFIGNNHIIYLQMKKLNIPPPIINKKIIEIALKKL